MYGVYSTEAAKQFGSSIYARPDGAEVEVTGVYNQPDARYGWPDAVWIGEVSFWKRPCQRGREQEHVAITRPSLVNERYTRYT